MTTNKKCVICLSELYDLEIEFPILCPTKCTNVCTPCSSHLKSDSNPSCPKCRADLSKTISDTHFMRCVRKMEVLVEEEIPDSDLSATELRMKYSVTESEVENTIRRLEDYASGENTNIQPLVTQIQKDQDVNPKISGHIDKHLLAGLELFMSEEEQLYITELMTSGDVTKLSQAAQILYEIKRINQINESNPVQSQVSSLLSRTLTAAEKRALKMSGLLEDVLPMPKHAVLKADFDMYARRGKVLKIKDDVWDGSLSDAFSRVYTSTSKDDDEGDHDGGAIPKKDENRVVVTGARRQAQKAGIKVGDVITHINMEKFTGNAENLRELICSFYEAEDDITFTLTLNADQSTAAALKERTTV